LFKTIPGRTKCDSPDSLLFLLNEILEYGGEGIILYKFDSTYEPGRSNVLYKLKVSLCTPSSLPLLSELTRTELITYQSKTAANDEETLVVESTSTHIKLQLYVTRGGGRVGRHKESKIGRRDKLF
jgi:hypothetical protein